MNTQASYRTIIHYLTTSQQVLQFCTSCVLPFFSYALVRVLVTALRTAEAVGSFLLTAEAVGLFLRTAEAVGSF